MKSWNETEWMQMQMHNVYTQYSTENIVYTYK
jgi:hypothetical protein